MITVKGDKNPLFILNTAHTTYAMKVLDTGHIEHLYYGRKIHMDDADGLTEQHEFAPVEIDDFVSSYRGSERKTLRNTS